MQSVVTSGTADRVGFPPSLNAAVKTVTAQTGNPKDTDDWMIGFAPANNPKIAPWQWWFPCKPSAARVPGSLDRS
jgi:cell division protein FtsI/penicillin-binding protein 2